LKVLIIHGWLHSANRYESIAQKLSKHSDIIIYEYGRAMPKTVDQLRYYTKCLQEHLDKNTYDVILTHSLGGRILLGTIYSSKYTILANIAYGRVRFLLPSLPVMLILLYLIKVLPKIMTYLPTKKIAGITMGNNNLFDIIMYTDVRKANIIASIVSAFELSIDSFRRYDRLNSKVIIIRGDKDNIVSRKNTLRLAKDLGVNKIITLKGIGHTSILEYEDYYVDLIKRL
jgi:hypothetical protein